MALCIFLLILGCISGTFAWESLRCLALSRDVVDLPGGLWAVRRSLSNLVVIDVVGAALVSGLVLLVNHANIEGLMSKWHLDGGVVAPLAVGALAGRVGAFFVSYGWPREFGQLPYFKLLDASPARIVVRNRSATCAALYIELGLHINRKTATARRLILKTIIEQAESGELELSLEEVLEQTAAAGGSELAASDALVGSLEFFGCNSLLARYGGGAPARALRPGLTPEVYAEQLLTVVIECNGEAALRQAYLSKRKSRWLRSVDLRQAYALQRSGDVAISAETAI